jgi:hypothetical protein
MADENTTLCIDRIRIQFEIFEDEMVLINVENGLYYNLSKSGSEVIQLVDNGCPIGMLVTTLLGNSLEATQYRLDIMHFVELLIQEGILVEAEAQSNIDRPTAIQSPIYSSAEAFQVPLLEKYDEVRDLLLIDPIHMVDQSKGWPKI